MYRDELDCRRTLDACISEISLKESRGYVEAVMLCTVM
jgi:hypothetical protein